MTQKDTRQHVLDTLITYFETGSKETDGVAKAILESDIDYWQEETLRFQNSLKWTGIRAPEAELLVYKLEEVKRLLE